MRSNLFKVLRFRYSHKTESESRKYIEFKNKLYLEIRMFEGFVFWEKMVLLPSSWEELDNVEQITTSKRRCETKTNHT